MSDLASPRAGAWAIVAGAIASVGLMAAHPASVGTMQIGPFDINQIVHAIAVLATPLLIYGAFALTVLIGRPLAGLALSFYAFGCVSIVSAAAMSGFVMTELVGAAHSPGALRSGVDFQSLADLTHWQNQAYAGTFTGLAAIAVLLWSIAWRKRGSRAGARRHRRLRHACLDGDRHACPQYPRHDGRDARQSVWMLFAARKMLGAKTGG